MKTIIVAIAIFTTTLAASASSDRASDEAAIRKLVIAVEDGWNAGDGKAFAAPFAEDADYVIVNGMHIKGREAIATGHQTIFDTIYKKSHNTATIKSIRFLREDIAVAHIEWHLKFRVNDEAREGKAMNSMVLTRQDGRWSIAAFHNTAISSAPR
jgi:uncharacterized protein (TIGR02246 family)